MRAGVCGGGAFACMSIFEYICMRSFGRLTRVNEGV